MDAVLVIACGVGQAAAVTVAAFATRDAFTALHSEEALAIRTISELALAGIIAAACLLMLRRRAEALGQSYAVSLRRALYAKIAGLPKSRHDERRVGALSLRFVGDLSAARLWFGRGLPASMSAAVVLPAAVAILIALDSKLALAGMLPLGIALTLMAALAFHLERRHQLLRRRRASIAISMIERIAIAPELDLMGRTNKELRSLDEQGAALRKNAVARRSRTAGLQAILQASVAMSGLSMLWVASIQGISPAIVAASLSVIALVALPMQDLANAWDQFCAWRVAREKAVRLLHEPHLERRSGKRNKPVSVALIDHRQDPPLAFHVQGGEVGTLLSTDAPQFARCVSGLDVFPDVVVLFDGEPNQARVAHVGDQYVGLQGSLRRSVTLNSRKRASDKRISNVLCAFGLADLLQCSKGLEQRIAENGKGLTASQTLRLDLARAVLGTADVVVIASLRWTAEPKKEALLNSFRQLTSATVILAETTEVSGNTQLLKAT